MTWPQIMEAHMRRWIAGLAALALLGCNGGEGDTGKGKDVAGGNDRGAGDALAEAAPEPDLPVGDIGEDGTPLPDKSGELPGFDVWQDVVGPTDSVTVPDHGADAAKPDTLTETTGPADLVADQPQPPEDLAPQDTGKDTGPVDPYPVPDPGEELPAPCQAALDDPYYFQFLDNLCDEKVWPTDQDRDRQCPVSDDSPFMTLKDGTVVEYKPADAPVVFDTQALNGLTPAGMEIAIILVKRIDGVPYFRYVSNGKHDVAMQPWSTTKFLAAANAAATLRIKSNYNVGLTASVKNIPVGDLVTSVCNYDDNPYSSNALGAWFHDVGGRNKANGLIHADWLNRPASETFGGNYGEAAPGLGYTFVEDNGATVTVPKDTTSGIANNLSMFTLAEALKRIVLHMVVPTQRLPGIQWKDAKVLLFGAEGSKKYGKWGGMTADTAIYLQMGHDIDYIEERSHGQWVIFSKLGLGTQGQFVHVGYACWPALDEGGNPVPGLGREFVIAAQLDQGGSTWAKRDRLLAETYRKIIVRIVDGRL
jgi:hypothetical protein